MTNREFFVAISENETLANDVREHAVAEIAKLDKANEARKAKASKKALENQPLVDRIVTDILSDTPVTASDVASVLEVSAQKASALLKTAVAQGAAIQQDIKLPKKGTCKGYTIAE